LLELHEENSKNALDFSRIRSTNKSKNGMFFSPCNELPKTNGWQISEGYNEEINSEIVRDLYENEKQMTWQLNAKNKRLENELNLLQGSLNKKK